MSTLVQDFRFALRVLRRNKTVAAMAVLTLALGMGSATAIFSVIDGVLLRPLPFPHPERLVMVFESDPDIKGGDHMITSIPLIRDWQEGNEVFDSLSILARESRILTGVGQPAEIPVAFVSASFFDLLEARILLGRGFAPADEVEDHSVAVVSEGFWKRLLGGDRQVLGKTIQLTGKPYEIIGVLAAGQEQPPETDVWAPAVFEAWKVHRGVKFSRAMARIREGLSLQQAQTGMETLAARLRLAYPERQGNKTVNLEPLQENLVGRSRSGLLLLMGAVGALLLIACVNVANLLLARSVSRRREFAVRVSLGADKLRLARQMIVESLTISFAGLLLGLPLAYWTKQFFVLLAPQEIPRLAEAQIDVQVLVIAWTLAAVTGILFGLAPALKSTRVDVTQSLKSGSRPEAGGFSLFRRQRLRHLLVIAEIALATLLLITAGLLMRSFVHLESQEPGFQTENLLAAIVSLPNYKYPEEQQQREFFDRLLERMRTFPQVKSVAAVNTLPFSQALWSYDFQLKPQGLEDSASYLIVTPEYFHTLGLQILKGRLFEPADRTGAPDVIIVNQTFVDRFLANQEPLSQQVGLNGKVRTIVGVVGNLKHFGLDSQPMPEIYLPFAQVASGSMMLVARTANDPLAMAPPFRSLVQSLDPDQPIYKLTTVESLIGETLATRRFYLLLLASFSAAALTLAIVGIYGVLSYTVGQSTHEIGVRMSLGAQRSQVFRMVARYSLILTAAGLAAGLAGAVYVSRFLQEMLFEIQPTDAPTYAAAALLLAAVALAAASSPALRASRVDPMDALRAE